MELKKSHKSTSAFNHNLCKLDTVYTSKFLKLQPKVSVALHQMSCQLGSNLRFFESISVKIEFDYLSSLMFTSIANDLGCR